MTIDVYTAIIVHRAIVLNRSMLFVKKLTSSPSVILHEVQIVAFPQHRERENDVACEKSFAFQDSRLARKYSPSAKSDVPPSPAISTIISDTQ